MKTLLILLELKEENIFKKKIDDGQDNQFKIVGSAHINLIESKWQDQAQGLSKILKKHDKQIKALSSKLDKKIRQREKVVNNIIKHKYKEKLKEIESLRESYSNMRKDVQKKYMTALALLTKTFELSIEEHVDQGDPLNHRLIKQLIENNTKYLDEQKEIDIDEATKLIEIEEDFIWHKYSDIDVSQRFAIQKSHIESLQNLLFTHLEEKRIYQEEELKLCKKKSLKQKEQISLLHNDKLIMESAEISKYYSSEWKKILLQLSKKKDAIVKESNDLIKKYDLEKK